MNKNLWWGYEHISGTHQAKRYFDKTGDLDIEDAYNSSLAKIVVGPFEANDRDEALKKVKELTKLKNNSYIEPEITREVEKDVIRLDFLDWLKEEEIIENPQSIWEKYITNRSEK